MAQSTCVKCGNTSFEMVDKEVKGSTFKLCFVQCSQCGTVVGVVDYYNIGELIHQLAKGLKVQLKS